MQKLNKQEYKEDDQLYYYFEKLHWRKASKLESKQFK